MEERPPPQVTVHDPSRPPRPADVLVSGDDEPRPNPFTKRRLQALGGVVLAAAAVAGAVELRERRATAAEERRLDRVLELEVELRSSSTSYDPSTGVAVLELQLGLRNEGPRLVRVVSGTAGGYRVVQDGVEVPAGEQTPLLLRRSLTCSPTSPPPAMPLSALSLELRTAAGPRTLSLDLPDELVSDEAARACGFVPLEEAVDVQLLGLSRLGGALELSLDLSSRSVDAISLVAVDGGPGLRAEVTATERGTADLPLPLPPDRQDGTRRGTSLEVRVTVEDCSSARTAPPQLALQVTDDAGRVAQPSLSYDAAFLGTLLSSACPS